MDETRRGQYEAAQKEIAALRRQAEATRAAASSVDRAAARVTAGLLHALSGELHSGVLAAKWADAKREAQGKVDDDEVEVAALATLMLELAKEGGKQAQLEAQRLAGEGRYLQGRADAMQDMLALLGAQPSQS